MSEPLYTYIKGQGWVLSEPLYTYIPGKGWVPAVMLTSKTFAIKTGELAHFEFRRPQVGEYYDSVGLDNTRYFNEDRTPKMDVWVDIYTRVYLYNLSVWAEDYVFDDDLGYLTVVLHD